MTNEHGSARARIFLRRGLQVLLGLVAGLVVAEAAFRYRDDGAFPHVNVYLPDAELGVRLEPGSEQRLRVGGNPVTTVRINALGFRGEEPGEPTEDEIVVVGDSQAFGLGVEENETFSHRLGELLGRPVVDAGVPTYGPLEYARVADRLLETRRAKTLIYVVNVANDLFEHSRPNAERHAVWDGWAVRVETKPRDVVDFPGRRWLMSRSHLVFAARGAWHRATIEADDRGFDSEGVFTDLVHAGQEAEQRHHATREELEAAESARRERLTALASEIESEERAVTDGLHTIQRAIAEATGRYDRFDADAVALDVYHAHPGDIFEEDDGESTRSITVTAEMIRRGATLRRRFAPRLQSVRQGGSLARSVDAWERESTERAMTALERAAALEEERARLSNEPLPEAFVPSVLEQRLVEIREICRRHDAELLVLVLPLDVQVASSEWAKYDVEPVDMSETDVLVRDIVETAHRLGARAVDTTEALRAAPAPVFLDRDIHLTPNGHRAVGEALAAALTEPAPIALPRPGLPDGRSHVPDRDAFLRTPENLVRGSSAAGCETVRIAEWLRVRCTKKGRSSPTGGEVLEGGEGEASFVVTEEASTLLVPLLPGRLFRARFDFTDRSQDLLVTWPTPDAPEMAFEPPSGPGRLLAVTEADARLCACWKESMGERACADSYGRNCEASCAGAYGNPSAECSAAYPDDCAAFVACARGALDSPPRCGPGHAVAGGARQCAALCSEQVPCEAGECVPWQGTSICR
jgi:hypothetical protein